MHGLQKMPDVRTCFGGGDEIQPQRIGLGVRGGDDFHAVAVFKRLPQRHQLLIDFDRHAAVADVGMHGIGEIYRSGAARQRHDLALGREYIHLIGKEIDFQVFEKLD